MKVLMINKFLYIRGGAESYMFNLGSGLSKLGHQVSYWGMYDDKNIINKNELLVRNYENENQNMLQKALIPINLIYSFEAKKKLSSFLDILQPDIVHIHNFNFQLSSSILDEISKRRIPIVYTAHDSQLVCPYHRMFQFDRNSVCDKCVTGAFLNCLKDRCFNGSVMKSFIATTESYFNHARGVYRKINLIISPSFFLKSMLEQRINQEIVVLPNFINPVEPKEKAASLDYVLYLGRLSKEKGLSRIIPVFEKLKIPLKIVGTGPEENTILTNQYIQLLGRKDGDELFNLIRQARFVIQPSIWYENCPMTVIESFSVGTPVIASNHSGFKELIQDGVNGFLIDFNSDTFGDEIRNCFYFANYKEMVEQSFLAFNNRFSPQGHLSKIERYYAKLLNG